MEEIKITGSSVLDIEFPLCNKKITIDPSEQDKLKIYGGTSCICNGARIYIRIGDELWIEPVDQKTHQYDIVKVCEALELKIRNFCILDEPRYWYTIDREFLTGLVGLCSSINTFNGG